MAGDTQAEYWADLEAYEQRSLAAKRPKVRALPQLPSAERYQGPVSPEAPSAEVSSAAPAVEAIGGSFGAPFAEADDLADVPTDREDFDDSESDDEDAASAVGPSNAGGGEEGAEQTAMVELPDRYARPGREGWATRNKDKYACQAGGQRVLEQNEKIALQVRVGLAQSLSLTRTRTQTRTLTSSISSRTSTRRKYRASKSGDSTRTRRPPRRCAGSPSQ